MKRTCDNCNRPLLETDTICWHCGHKQPLPVKREAPPEHFNKERAEEDELTTEIEPVAFAVNPDLWWIDRRCRSRPALGHPLLGSKPGAFSKNRFVCGRVDYTQRPRQVVYN